MTPPPARLAPGPRARAVSMVLGLFVIAGGLSFSTGLDEAGRLGGRIGGPTGAFAGSVAFSFGWAGLLVLSFIGLAVATGMHRTHRRQVAAAVVGAVAGGVTSLLLGLAMLVPFLAWSSAGPAAVVPVTAFSVLATLLGGGLLIGASIALTRRLLQGPRER